MRYLCQFGENLAIGSEDKMVDKALSVIWSWCPWKLGQGHKNLSFPFGCPEEVSVQVWSKSIQ